MTPRRPVNPIATGMRAQYVADDSIVAEEGGAPVADCLSSHEPDNFNSSFGGYGQACYGSSDTCQGEAYSPWFGGLYGLMMTRDDDDSFILDCDCTPLQTSDAAIDWQGGVEARLGRYICDGPWAWEFVYWGIYPNTQEANSYSANTAFDLTTLNYGGGTINDLYDGAARHRLRRSLEIRNIELNLLSGISGSDCSPWQFGWALGVRYLSVDTDLQYASADTDTTFGVDPSNEAYYDIGVENQLVGFQLGLRADRQLWQDWSLFGETKFGLYGNHIEHTSWIGGATGTAAVVNAGTYNGSDFDVTSTKNDVSFLGEFRVGANYYFTPMMRATIGYRAVAVTGVALETSQFPQDFRYLNEVSDVNSNGSMILHGGFAGLEYNY